MMTKTNRSNEELALIVVAAGSSSRMGGIKKEYLPLESGTVLSTAVKAFLRTLPFSVVAVTFPNQENPELLKSAEEKCKNALFEDKEFNKIANNTEFIFVPGGASRQSSVFNALLKIKANFPNSNPVVFIHDGARPFVSKKIINSTFAAVQKYGASAPGIQPTDTQNEIDKNGFIKRHLVRSQLTAVQTPQVFMLNELVEAHKKAQAVYEHHDGKLPTLKELTAEYAALKGQLDAYKPDLAELQSKLTDLKHIRYNYKILIRDIPHTDQYCRKGDRIER